MFDFFSFCFNSARPFFYPNSQRMMSEKRKKKMAHPLTETILIYGCLIHFLSWGWPLFLCFSLGRQFRFPVKMDIMRGYQHAFPGRKKNSQWKDNWRVKPWCNLHEQVQFWTRHMPGGNKNLARSLGVTRSPHLSFFSPCDLSWHRFVNHVGYNPAVNN